MIGARSSGVLRRKKDKKVEAKKSVHARMQLVARVYLCFREIYSNQTEVKLTDLLDNAADTYRRETIGILGSAVNKLTERSSSDVNHVSVTGQKGGLKVSILRLLKYTAKFFTGYFLVQNSVRSRRVADFLQVLKLFEDELFGNA